MTEKIRGVGGRFAPKDSVGAEDERATVKAPKPKFCRVFVRDRVAEALPKIVAKLISQAKKGSVPHATLLLKTAGLDSKGEIVPVARRRSKGLAQILKEQWEADEAKFAEAERQRQPKTVVRDEAQGE